MLLTLWKNTVPLLFNRKFLHWMCLMVPHDYIKLMHSQPEYCIGDVPFWERHACSYTTVICSSRVMVPLITGQGGKRDLPLHCISWNFLSPLQQISSVQRNTWNAHKYCVPHQNFFLYLESIDYSCLNQRVPLWLQSNPFPRPGLPHIYRLALVIQLLAIPLPSRLIIDLLLIWTHNFSNSL